MIVKIKGELILLAEEQLTILRNQTLSIKIYNKLNYNYKFIQQKKYNKMKSSTISRLIIKSQMLI